MRDLAAKLHSVLGDLYSPVINGLKIISIIVISIIVVKIGSIIIKKIFEKQKGFKYSISAKRLDTMSTLLVSVFRYMTYLVAGVVILSDVFQLKSVLAAAGIGGIAVGLGAQSLIKDVISGFFIVMEDQFVVGDLITIDNMTGTVEEMELRVTKMRHFNGDLFIIPNGEIKKVTNHTRGNKAVNVDIPIAYSADINKAIEVAQTVCAAVGEEFTTIVEPLKVLGITDLGKESLNLRITAKTLPNEQWEVERKIRIRIKEAFSKSGIEFFDKNKIELEKES
ncbi:MAG: mechanosensitive ion channel family protein [Clostridia bacterium]|nr:mechanosensitive ion channel family protein [Clostridia bacterium]